MVREGVFVSLEIFSWLIVVHDFVGVRKLGNCDNALNTKLLCMSQFEVNPMSRTSIFLLES